MVCFFKLIANQWVYYDVLFSGHTRKRHGACNQFTSDFE